MWFVSVSFLRRIGLVKGRLRLHAGSRVAGPCGVERADSPGEPAPSAAPSARGLNFVVSDCQCEPPASCRRHAVLLDDLADHARANRAATLSDGEAQALVHGDRLNQFD